MNQSTRAKERTTTPFTVYAERVRPLAAAGFSAKDIATMLCIPTNTVAVVKRKFRIPFTRDGRCKHGSKRAYLK